MSNDPTQNMNLNQGQSNNQIGDGSELEVADPADIFFAERDSSGNPAPVKQKVPGRNEAVRTVPPTEGYYNEYLNPVPAEDNEKIAEMLNKGFPDLDVTAEDVESGLLIYSLETMTEILKRAGGYDMYSAIEEQQEQENISQIKMMVDALGIGGEDMGIAELFDAMEEMDEEKIEAAAESADDQQGMSPGPARPNGE